MANGSSQRGVSGEGSEVRKYGNRDWVLLGWKGHNHAGDSLTAETETWDWLGFGGGAFSPLRGPLLAHLGPRFNGMFIDLA